MTIFLILLLTVGFAEVITYPEGWDELLSDDKSKRFSANDRSRTFPKMISGADFPVLKIELATDTYPQKRMDAA